MVVKFMAVLASVLGVLVAAFACVICYYIWPEKDSTMPAWIQAIGSVAAIFVAIAIVGVQLRHQSSSAAQQVRDEQSNLILATLFYATNAHAVCRAVKEAIGSSEKMPLPLLTFTTERMVATGSNIDALPIWKMAPIDALELARVQIACKNMVAALRTAADAELRSPTPQPLRGVGIHLIAAVGVANAAKISEDDANQAIRYLRDRYKSLSGTDAPGM